MPEASGLAAQSARGWEESRDRARNAGAWPAGNWRVSGSRSAAAALRFLSDLGAPACSGQNYHRLGERSQAGAEGWRHKLSFHWLENSSLRTCFSLPSGKPQHGLANN